MEKVLSITEEEIEKIGDAYANYNYPSTDKGMFIFNDKNLLKKYIMGFARACFKAGILYTTSNNHEGYIAVVSPADKISPMSGINLMVELIKAIGFKNFKTFIKFCQTGGESIEDKMKKDKKKFVCIELLVVTEEYQGKGYMRKLMEFAFSKADEQNIPCIVDTDEGLKRDKYCHLGVHEVVRRDFGDNRYSYGMIREAV